MATVLYNGASHAVACGTTLSVALGIDAPCGGHGRCGNCKVIATGALSPADDRERAHLTAAELAFGVRLACCAVVLGDCTVIPYATPGKAAVLIDGAAAQAPISPRFRRYGVALDLGTTTLAARLYAPDGSVLAACGRLNPQGRFGADVISRIEASLGGNAKELSTLILNAVEEMLCELALAAKIILQEIDALCITGNTAMLYLLTASDPTALSRAPFAADQLFGQERTAKSLGISVLGESTPVLLPPCISAFVGADAVCALLATKICERAESALLADIGTNGEIALWHNGALRVCSTAAGPAFEGAGIEMGMRCAPGAIDRVQLVNGKPIAHVIGETTPTGICGSGLVDAVACLLDMEELDETGYVEDALMIAPPVRLVANDIRMLQLAKSAICAGLQTAMQQADLSPAEISALYVAGGFGMYLNKKSAARIGLIPQALADKIKPVGNAALDGAAMLLLNKQALDTAKTLASTATTLELSTSSVFADFYVAGMLLKKI